MNRQTTSISALRWVVGLVVLVEAVHFTLSSATVSHLSRAGIPLWIRPVLGWGEALAAILFLVPAAPRVGGFGLLLTLAAAVALHFHSGDYGVGALIVYSAAVIVCITDHERNVGNKTA